MKMRIAFTLAEVLIALTIIGVIAAITIPALIQRTNKQEYVTALQKAYSTLSQATQQIIAENGSPKGEDSWLSNVDSVYEMYKNFLNGVKECGASAGCLEQGNYKCLTSGNCGSWDTDTSRKKLIMADGMQVVFDASHWLSNECDKSGAGSNDVCAAIIVDINGVKKPNTVGRDVFYFVLKENALLPRGCDQEGWCNGPVDNRGYGCACKVLREGAMNY